MHPALNTFKKALQEVYHQKQYYVYTFLGALIVFSLNPLFRNYRLLKAQFSWTLVYTLVAASPMTSELFSLVMLLGLALLSGIVLSFTLFLIKRQVSQNVNVGFMGILLGIVAPACPSCALGLLGILGIGGILAVLPFKGMELGFLGIILLFFSLTRLSTKIVTATCALSRKKR